MLFCIGLTYVSSAIIDYIMYLTRRRQPAETTLSATEEKNVQEKQSVELVKIFDTTLRDGEQSPGNTMNLQEKLRVARQLESWGLILSRPASRLRRRVISKR